MEGPAPVVGVIQSPSRASTPRLGLGEAIIEPTNPSLDLDMSVLATTATGRPRRSYRLPKRFRDILPEPLTTALPKVVETPSVTSSPPIETTISLDTRVEMDHFQTTTNYFGLWRDYPQRPSSDPDGVLKLKDLVNSQAPDTPDEDLDCLSLHERVSPPSDKPAHWPFANMSIYRFMEWLNNGATAKSEADVTALVENCILAPDFCPEDMVGFNAHRENKKMDRELADSQLQSHFDESSVGILVPSGSRAVPPQEFRVPGLLHRKLTTVIREAFNDPLAHLLHYSPFKLFHQKTQNDNIVNERIYGEIYSSDVFIEEHEKIQLHGELPLDDLHCKRERVVAALMFASDATRLANFGTAKAWPIYMMLGNISKYTRSKASSGALHHLAYIPSVSHRETPPQ